MVIPIQTSSAALRLQKQGDKEFGMIKNLRR